MTMKKLAILCISLLFAAGTALRAQDEITFSLIPRLDGTLYSYPGDGSEMTLGASALYSLFEGNLGDFSWSVSNHWLSTDPASLYRDVTLSTTYTFLDWAYLAYGIGDFTVTLGKQCVALGGFEYDKYDYEIFDPLASRYWNDASAYQWGGMLSWAPSENHSFDLQLVSSPTFYMPELRQDETLVFPTAPYERKYFAGGDYGLFLRWYGSMGNFSTIWSLSNATYHNVLGRGNYVDLVLGNQYEAGNWNFTLDYYYRWGMNYQAMFSVEDRLSDHFALKWKAGFIDGARTDRSYQFGTVLQYYPLQGSDNLRIHALCSYGNFYGDTLTVGLGLTWRFDWTLLER